MTDVLSSLFNKFIDLVWDEPLLCFISCLVLGVMAVLPVHYPVLFGLDALRVFFVLVSIFLLLRSIGHLADFARGLWWRRRERRRHQKKVMARLKRLTLGQKMIMRQFVYDGELYLQLWPGEDVHGLVRAEVITGDSMFEVDWEMRAYSRYEVDPWAVSYLRTHPNLLK